MSVNKFVVLFDSLSGVEKREASVFLNSPYFNRREDVLRLWEALLKDKGRRKGLEPEALFRTVYPGRPFDDAAWRHVLSFLQERLETFLAQRAVEQAPLLYDLHLAPVLREKGQEKALSHLFRRADVALQKLPRDHGWYALQYQLEWEKYAALESHSRTRDNNLAEVGRAFDVYLIAGKLRLSCLTESHRAVYNVDYDPGFLPALLAWLENSELLHTPIVALYYHCYRALTDGSETDFRAFRRQLEQQSDLLPAEERQNLLLLAVNYCIRRLNTGEKRYIREAFDLYRVGLDTGALLENGFLSRFAYKNIVALGLRLEEFAWVEHFIHQYEPCLEEKYRSANRDYNLARLYFIRKDFRRAMPLLARVDESDLLLNLDSRVMLLKMYYESGEWDALDALLSSFRVLLLRKKKVIGYHQTHYLHLLRYVQKLVRLNLQDKSAVERFRQDIQGNAAVPEKEWLLEQLEP